MIFTVCLNQDPNEIYIFWLTEYVLNLLIYVFLFFFSFKTSCWIIGTFVLQNFTVWFLLIDSLLHLTWSSIFWIIYILIVECKCFISFRVVFFLQSYLLGNTVFFHQEVHKDWLTLSWDVDNHWWSLPRSLISLNHKIIF